ncbi:hypothetical protein BGX26_012171 [Mortierella sp. AD094]|nr:hypothetical protein BGX26_012171 [Mortierella sp. AD094]
MGIQPVQLLAVAPLAFTLLSGAVCTLASGSSNLALNPHAAPPSPAQFTRREPTFNYTLLPNTNASDNTTENSQPKAKDIKIRNFILLFLSLIPTLFLVASCVLVLTSQDSAEGTPFERLFAPVSALAGWVVTLLVLLGVITHRINYMIALQPLQWFYSTAAVVVIIDLWTLVDVIVEGDHSFEMWIYFGVGATVLTLAALALAMPAELDLGIVHQYGYGYSSEKHSTSPEAYASYLSWLSFSWFNGIIKMGSIKTLNLSDLPELVPLLRARTVWSQFQIFTGTKPSATLLRRILSFNALSLSWQFTFTVISTFLDFSVPYFLKLFLSYINDPTVHPKVAYFYVILIFVSQVARSLVQAQTYYLGCKIIVSMMALLNSEIYAKALTRRDMSGVVHKKKDGKDGEEKKGHTPASLGKVVNLMSTDASRVTGMCNFWHIGVSSTIGIAIGGYLLYDLLGWSSLVGLSILVITIPANKAVNRLYSKGQMQLSSARDDRVTATNELITGIRMIKFFAWETSFSEKVLKTREFELKKLVNVFKIAVLMQILWFASPLLVTLASFFCYVKLQNGVFTPAVAFTAVVLFDRMKNPLNGLPQVYIALTNASVSLSRIAEYLDEPNIKDVSINGRKSGHGSPEIGLKGVTAQWWTTESAKTPDPKSDNSTQPGTEDNERFALRDISVAFPAGELSIVCGPTGSGKTSLLLAILGETDVLQGEIFLPRSDSKSVDPETGLITDGVAFVSQQAWLQNASIRDNILFGSKYEEDRYNQVVEVCALKRDLEIFEDGDQTEIGEKGITLSGGQKQRVSLARAIYSRARHVFLDDCLSAVDAHTAQHIHSKCLTGPIMKNRTCILVTHHVRLCIPTAKHVLLMNNGEIKAQGSVQQLREQGSLSLVLDGDEDEDQNTESSSSGAANEAEAVSSTPTGLAQGKSTAKDGQEPATPEKVAKKLVQEENREEGHVKLSIYLTYATAVGGIVFWTVILASYAVARSMDVSKSLWVREWSNSYEESSFIAKLFSNGSPSAIPNPRLAMSPINFGTQGFQIQSASYDSIQTDSSNQRFSTIVSPEKHSTDYYLLIYALISVATILTYVGQTIIDLYGALQAARSLYKKLLFSVVHAPLRFFDTTPVGRIMNRFSRDFETVDASISDHMCMFITYSVSILSVFILLAYITPLFIIIAVIITAAYLIVGKMYIDTSRELKRLHSVTRSPIYSKFGETLAGVATIRAFNEQHRFMGDLLTKIDDSNRPFYNLWNANRWLSVRSDSIGAIVALSSGIFILMNPIGIDAGTAGLALTYALEFVASVNFLIRMYTEIEMDLSSIERIMEYTTMPLEPPAIIETRRPPAAWPTGGSIEVKDLEMKYAPDLETVVRGVSFTVEPHQKIGVVGRTGSGKSTLALSLFRFVEPVGGSIHIDGINICDIGLEDLRSRLTIIPQDPMLFTGTIRSNLDPFNDHLDSELWEALRRVHLVGSEQVSSDPTTNDNGGDGTSTPLSSESGAKPRNVSFSSLENPVSEGGSNFSQGQRQLLCMARALLRNSKVIVMDEATASVDFATDRLIQSAIQQEFENSTVLCIAHRLNTIITYDKVLVLDHGKVLEYDTPANLLDAMGGKRTHFREMCERSGELDVLLEMVRNNGTK